MILIRRVGIPPSKDRVLKPFPELLGGAEDPLVDEVYEREVLEQIVLYRGSGEENSTLTFQSHQSTVRLVLMVLQPKGNPN